MQPIYLIVRILVLNITDKDALLLIPALKVTTCYAEKSFRRLIIVRDG
jgi:hypothetical protein